MSGQEFFVSISIGISVFPDDGDKAERLLQHADTALYQAKEEGRHAFRFFTPDMNRRAQRRAAMEGHLLHAVERKELSLVYQPIVSLRTGTTVAFEALLRWQNPALGAVSPGLFVPLAEETGLIQEIGEWVLDQAMADLTGWDAGPGLRLAVNVSSRQLRNPRRFLSAVEAALHRHRAGDFLCQTMQLELSPEAIALLEERTEGWVAGLQLAALSLADADFSFETVQQFGGRDRYVAEYILTEVLDRLPPDIQQFLISTAVFDRFNPDYAQLFCNPRLPKTISSKLKNINI